MQLRNSTFLSLLSYLVLSPFAVADQNREPRQQLPKRQASILPATLPSCAPVCPALINAQQACAPTASDQATYKTCFCESAYLNTVQTSPSNICSPQCSDADFGSIANWFKGFCGVQASTSAAGQGTPTTALTSITTPGTGGTTSSVTTNSATPVPEAAGDGTDADEGNSWEDPPMWFRGHWKWVLMIVVLVVVFAIIAVVGTIFHRRHKRRRDYGSTAAATGHPPTHSDLGGWGPSAHSVHNIGGGHDPMPQESGVMTGGDGVLSEKGKGKERADIARGQSKRLTKERY